MSGTGACALPRGNGRVLMLGTFVLALAAAVVLALGTHDARLLRLGLLAALWAALLGAFAAARMRRDSSSCVDRVDQLRTVYQLELEREVAARREHALTVEGELRERAELSQRREIVELRAELAALRTNLEQLLGGNPLVERVTLRAESTRLRPLTAHPQTFDDTHNRIAAASVVSRRTGPELRFGPGHPTPNRGCAPSPAHTTTSNGQGRHGVPSQEWSGSTGHHNGSHNNGASARAPGRNPSPPAAQAQRTVNDLLAAHREDAAVRRGEAHAPPA